MLVLKDTVDIRSVLNITRERGYFFVPDAIDQETCAAMEREIDRLKLEFGDHVAHPINKGTSQEVQQWHERVYRPIDHPDVPIGTQICYAVSERLAQYSIEFPELVGWLPTEIGYQRYRDAHDWISPHRDRRSDQLLSLTYTIKGSAWMRIYESEVDPPDYTRLKHVDEFLTQPGTAMFLRAPGFGSGKQVIHEVMPPLEGSRLILNLRMRPTILKSPTEMGY
jgi:hypothetical protein